MKGCLTNYCSGAYADTKSIPKVKGQLWVGMAGTLRSLKFPSNCSHVRLLVFGSHALDAVCRFCFEMGQHSMTAKGRPTFWDRVRLSFSEEVLMGGGDVHVVEMRVFWLFLIRMSPFAHLLSLHRLLKCYFQPKVPKPMEKRRKHSFTPYPLSSFSDPLYGSSLFVFSRLLPVCQSNNASCLSYICVFVHSRMQYP